ncbi:Bdr protein [Crocosphaera sp. UHCC 0190]|uniref:Bdr protein n=1 Tax=Crocosphaera sp. UHCC 0190 TaxID=3110246 RepID=UPI002B1FA14C|nr:Bdr protein [Crocosphaera sp. UHCC 0190]MEA5511303.1 Bdr protein [Crocosphaera sp. UHCC 0190]
MSQTPITVTYSLEEILGQINSKLDKLDDKFEDKFEQLENKVEAKFEQLDDKFETKFEQLENKFETKLDKLDEKFDAKFEILDEKVDHLQKDVISLTGDVKTLDAKVEGIGKRLDTQEFINRSVVVGFVLAIGTGAVKLFFPNFPH